MKKLTLSLVIVVIMIAVSVSPVLGASGWTSFGAVSQAQINDDGVRIKIEVSSNPSKCSQSTWFYYNGDATTINRFYATALTMMSVDGTMQVYGNDICNQWGFTQISTINMMP